jgi:multisubunit Na+/H+ antiporter MnhF subunit
MSPWLIAACVLLVTLLIPLGVCMRRPLMDALLGLELAGMTATVVLLLLAEGFHRTSLFDPALVLALMTLVGSLAFARFMERRV